MVLLSAGPAAGAWLGTRETTETLCSSTNILCSDGRWFGVATAMGDAQGLPGIPRSSPPRLLNRQGWSTLVAGALLLLISFTTNDGDDNLFQFGNLQAAHKVGICLHLAALAALAGDSQLATRLGHRAANEAARAERARQREALETAEEREQPARRPRIQNGCLAAQCRLLLADSARNRLQLSEVLAVLLLARAAGRESLASSESSRRQRPQPTRQACGEKHSAGAHRRGRNVLRTHKLGGAFQSRVPGGSYASPLEHNWRLG